MAAFIAKVVYENLFPLTTLAIKKATDISVARCFPCYTKQKKHHVCDAFPLLAEREGFEPPDP